MIKTMHIALLLAIFLVSCGPSSPTPTPVPLLTTQPKNTATFTPTAGLTSTPVNKIYLSEIEPLSATVGAFSVAKGVFPEMEDSFSGQVLISNGQLWKNGLFAHAPSRIDFVVNGAYQTLTGWIMMSDKCQAGDGAIFHIEIDDREVYSSPVLTYATGKVPFETDIYGAKVLSLSVEQLKSVDCDWSIWGDPQLTRADYVITPTPDPNLPCAGNTFERIYMFMDCADILRVRDLLNSQDPSFVRLWNSNLAVLDGYRNQLPKTYNNLQSAGVLWSGQIPIYLRNMTLVYLITGQQDYAEDLKYMLDLIQRSVPNTTQPFRYNNIGALVSHPKHGVNPNISVLFAYLALRDSDYYTEQQRSSMDDFMIQQGETALSAIPVLSGHVGINSPTNRNVSAASAILATAVAAAFPDDPRAQNLYPRARAELDWMISNWWHPDGGWGEDTDSYSINRLDSLLLAAETIQRNLGDDMYSESFNGQTLNNICRYFLHVLTPEGVPPAINDSAHISLDPGVLRLCAYRTNDAELAWAANQYRWGIEHAYGSPPISGGDIFFHELAWAGLPPVPQKPNYKSVNLEDTGVAILRDGWDHESSYALLQYTKSLVHAENSFGALYLFDGGPWIVGNGYHLLSFGMGAEGQSTKQHNTLTIDGISHQNIGGEMQAFADLNQIGIESVQGKPYDFADFRRMVLWIKEWHQWLVVDDVEFHDSNSHSLQSRWFVRTKTPGMQTNQDSVWNFTRTVGNPTQLNIAMFPQQSATYQSVQRQYPWEEWISDAYGVEMDLPNQSNSARIVTSLTSSNSAPITTRLDEIGGTQITSSKGVGENDWIWLIPLPGKNSANFAEGSMTGLASCLRFNGSTMLGYCLLGGTDLTHNGQNLVDCTGPINIEVNFDENQIDVQTKSSVNISLYWPWSITKLMLNGQAISFTEENDRVYLNLPIGDHILTIE